MEIFIDVINKMKEKMYEKYKKDYKTIEIKSNLEIKKKEKEVEIDNIINYIESIIEFSDDNEVLLIYFTSNFWINIFKSYIEAKERKIQICFDLRVVFIKYNVLFNELFKKQKIYEKIK